MLQACLLGGLPFVEPTMPDTTDTLFLKHTSQATRRTRSKGRKAAAATGNAWAGFRRIPATRCPTKGDVDVE